MQISTILLVVMLRNLIKLLLIVAKDAFPSSTVGKPGFKHLVSKLNPRYEIPSRKHFSEYEISALYSLIKESKVKPVLAQAGCFSATTDLWTSGSCDTEKIAECYYTAQILFFQICKGIGLS